MNTTNLHNHFLAAVLLFLFLTASACNIDTSSGEGSVLLRLGDTSRSIWYPDGESDFMEIDSYKITFTKGDTEIVSQIAPSTTFVMDALEAGMWTVQIEGYNEPLIQDTVLNKMVVSGDQVAYLESRDVEGNPRNILVEVNRGEVTQAQATLVPIDNEGSGILEITVNWPQTGSNLILNNPKLTLSITNINDRFDRYTDSTYTNESETSDTSDTKTVTFSELPLGWYEVMTTLTSTNPDNSDVQIWRGIDFARVTYDPSTTASITTSGTITISDLMLETGSINLDINEDGFELLPVTLSAQAGGTTLTDGNGAYVLNTSSAAEVSFAATTGFESYYWYVDGDDTLITATDSETSLVFTESGKYTVTVFVLGEGIFGSDSLEVTIVRQEEIHQPY